MPPGWRLTCPIPAEASWPFILAVSVAPVISPDGVMTFIPVIFTLIPWSAIWVAICAGDGLQELPPSAICMMVPGASETAHRMRLVSRARLPRGGMSMPVESPGRSGEKPTVMVAVRSWLISSTAEPGCPVSSRSGLVPMTCLRIAGRSSVAGQVHRGDRDPAVHGGIGRPGVDHPGLLHRVGRRVGLRDQGAGRERPGAGRAERDGGELGPVNRRGSAERDG